MQISVCDRATKTVLEEKVYGKFFLTLLYGKIWWLKWLAFLALPVVTRCSFFSKWYGQCQKTRWSRRKIIPFIKKFNVDSSEFSCALSSFRSFNDFFIRTLKNSARPIATGEDRVVLPADGRYLVFPSIDQSAGFYVKGQTFDLKKLLRDPALIARYHKGSLVIARLCPTDCHRFCFPVECIPSKPRPVKGPLYSVNPLALRDRLAILSENERVMTTLSTSRFGEILFIEVGATFVGAIRQTYHPETMCKKGAEKGYFEFGGSCILLLFEPEKVVFDEDLIQTSLSHIEMQAKMGDSLGSASFAVQRK